MSACSTTGKYVCEIPVFGNYIDTSSLVLLAQSFSVLVQFFLFIALGSLADYGNHRKSMMILLTNATALIGICVLFVIDSSVWYLAFIIYVLSNIAFGASHVFNYAWIPILTRYSQEVVDARDDPLVSDEEYFVVSDKVGNEISTKGLFYGYISSLVQIIIAVVFAYFVKAKMIGLTSTYPLQICIAAICAFMFLMTTFYTSKMVKSRPGPPMNPNTNFALQSYKNCNSY